MTRPNLTHPEKALVRVAVYGPGGKLLDQSVKVVLRENKRSTACERAKGALFHEARVAPGRYRLEAAARDLVTPPRDLDVPPEGRTVALYLGRKDWPFYRLGENAVPFEPREELLAVVFPNRRPDPETARRLAEELVRSLPLATADFAGEQRAGELSWTAGERSIWLFRLTQPGDEADHRKVADELRRRLGEEVRVGIPVDVERGQVKVMDQRFIVRFGDHVKPAEIGELVERAGGRILRGFIQAGNARLVEFLRGGYREHLAILEEWRGRGLLVYAEPDLIAEITDDVFPATPPNDPTFPGQLNLTLQGADTAWQLLNGIDAARTLGSPNVTVATVDRGVQPGHPDVGGLLTDGTAQIAQCYDFQNLQPCSAMGYTPDAPHGMGVYGIVAAHTDNATAIAGIAPNTHQVAIKRPVLLESANYPDVLLWAAGFVTGNPSPGWPAEPNPNPADIISCSHGQNGLALSGIMDDTFQFLATYGRNGRGTVMIYSAGNANHLITGFRTWAAHPRTLAIANSQQPDGMGVERRVFDSNFGPELDICAQGAGAPSLNPTSGEQIFGGTSAAAPTVAAAAALMLSAEPALTWIDVRDLLRQTAVQIDPANADPVGQWVGGFSQWYGFGRLDIHAAVQGADGFDPGAVRVLLRDNLADTGLVLPAGGTFWRSPDLWVRRNDPAADPIGDPAYGDAPPNEAATAGADNWIRVRVANAGTAPSANFYVRVYLTHFAGTEFQYPEDFIPSVTTGDPLPSPLVQATYKVGEQLVTSLADGTSQILNFLWPAEMVPPEIVNGTHWHPCLLAEATPYTGLPPTGPLVIDRSNIAQRNITIDYADDDSAGHEMTGVIGHASDDSRLRRIVVHGGALPKKARIWVRFLDPRVEAAVLRRLRSTPQAHPTTEPCCCAGTPALRPAAVSTVKVDALRGRRIFRAVDSRRLALEVPMVGGPLTPVVVGAILPAGTPKGSYEVVLTEHGPAGQALGAFSLEVIVR